MIRQFGFLMVGLSVGLSQGSAQVVQLPTFNQFTVNTTVSVPDGGGTTLARVPTGRWSRSTRSIPLFGRVPGIGRAAQQTVLSREASFSQATVRATIVDHREWDEAILGASSSAVVPLTSPTLDPIEQRARFLSQHIGRSALNPHLPAKSQAGATPTPASQAARFRNRPAETGGAEPPLVLKRR